MLIQISRCSEEEEREEEEEEEEGESLSPDVRSYSYHGTTKLHHVVGGSPPVLGVGLEVLDDVREEVRPLHAAARRLVAQLGEVDVEVVVGRLVVQLGPSEQLGQGVLSDGSLLQDDHSLLIAELVTTTIYISDRLS
ncbi:hypothetical protein EYF80_030339 [Liparis tanakae]|uniref:Uncharacterized protein n=1 Tax=Liparis tanakae TaxID=230148 RepID=A0A4Z2H3N0_9TELE|nr:hypothetical protein EYF80_030339 [Liparis tanakae]